MSSGFPKGELTSASLQHAARAAPSSSNFFIFIFIIMVLPEGEILMCTPSWQREPALQKTKRRKEVDAALLNDVQNLRSMLRIHTDLRACQRFHGLSQQIRSYC